MFFKNIHIYHITDQTMLSGTQLHAALESKQARSCGQMEISCQGWAKPLGLDGQMLTHETDSRIMICLRREEKVLPASLIREHLEEKVFKIEQETGRRVGRKERLDIKDQLMNSLLPKALTRATHTYGYIDQKNRWLIVNATSAKKADEFTSFLQKTLSSLNVVKPQTAISPESAMTQWLLNHNSLPEGFDIEDEVELRSSSESKSVIRCKHVDLLSDEIRSHVMSGKRVFRLAMNWNNRMSFVLHDDLTIKRIKFSSEVTDEADAGGDEIAQFDADFTIFASEFSEFIPALLSAFSLPQA